MHQLYHVYGSKNERHFAMNHSMHLIALSLQKLSVPPDLTRTSLVLLCDHAEQNHIDNTYVNALTILPFGHIALMIYTMYYVPGFTHTCAVQMVYGVLCRMHYTYAWNLVVH